jgi:hypothetical protein
VFDGNYKQFVYFVYETQRFVLYEKNNIHYFYFLQTSETFPTLPAACDRVTESQEDISI